MGKGKKKKKKSKLSPTEKALRNTQRRFKNQIALVFKTADFKCISTRNKHFEFKGHKSEFDNVFVHKNIVVVAEETCLKSSDLIRAHLLKKDLLYKGILANKEDFIKFLGQNFPDFKRANKEGYEPADMNVIVLYCSKNRIEDDHKKHFGHILFLEDRHLQYFCALVRTLGRSGRFEVFKFLGLTTDQIGRARGEPYVNYDGFILPESPSGFPSGFKIVTFYIDPEALLVLSYVLRKDGWGDGDNLYQRMISRSKIKSMRQYLGHENRVFINNVIVSLPSASKILDHNNKQIDISKIAKTTPVKIQIPRQFNSIGIIDGQHRVFAYHEGDDHFEKQIALKRVKQQLLVTGVVYPDSVVEGKQHEFEAQLFLEINDKQTKTKADLRQAIEAIVNPFSTIAISRSVITRLAAREPLCGYLEEHQFDRGKLKSSSIVGYGLRHIIKAEGDDTLFNLWKHSNKQQLAAAIKAASAGKKKFTKPPKAVLEDYVQFCSTQINNVLIGYKMAVQKDLWTADRKQSRAISTTAINGVIYCLRILLKEKKTKNLEQYQLLFKKMSVDFTPLKFKYKSSHWRELGEKIYTQCFA